MFLIELADGRSMTLQHYLSEAQKEIDIAKGLDRKIAEVRESIPQLESAIVESRAALKDCETALHDYWKPTPIESAKTPSFKGMASKLAEQLFDYERDQDG